jgi:hypothetical protein
MACLLVIGLIVEALWLVGRDPYMVATTAGGEGYAAQR